MAAMPWHGAKFITHTTGEQPFTGVMSNNFLRKFNLQTCCLRPATVCDGPITCPNRNAANALAQYNPPTRTYESPPRNNRPSAEDKKRAREAASECARDEGKKRLLERKLQGLCLDFKAGKVRYAPATQHASN